MLLDSLLPVYDFNEVHAIKVRAARPHVFRSIKEVTPAEIPWLRALFAIRSFPARLSGKGGRRFARAQPLLEQALGAGFVLLAEDPDRELVLGRIGRFWRLSGDFPPPIADLEEFLAFHRPGYGKAALNFYMEEREGGGVSVRTETRISVPDPAARKKFSRYWRLISFGSAFIRRMWLRAIKRRAERGR